MREIIATLEDVDGVVGSFVANESGTVLASALPSFFGHDVIRQAAPRVLSAVESVADLSRVPQFCEFAFAEHRLFAWPFDGGCLLILTENRVNTRALKMASKLVTRRLVRVAGEGTPLESMREPLVTPSQTAPISYPSRLASEVSSRRLEEDSSGIAPTIGREPEMPMASGRRPVAGNRATESPESRSSRASTVHGRRTIVYRGRKYEL